MSLSQWGPWIGAIVGAGGLGTGAVALFKARPEANKIKADAAQVLQDASADWVQAVSDELKDLRREVATMKREREQDHRRLRVHERWDNEVADQVRRLGGHVTDPPPLYPDPTPA